MNRSKKGLSFILALAGTLMLLASLFLPYISATEEHAKELDSGQTVFFLPVLSMPTATSTASCPTESHPGKKSWTLRHFSADTGGP